MMLQTGLDVVRSGQGVKRYNLSGFIGRPIFGPFALLWHSRNYVIIHPDRVDVSIGGIDRMENGRRRIPFHRVIGIRVRTNDGYFEIHFRRWATYLCRFGFSRKQVVRERLRHPEQAKDLKAAVQLGRKKAKLAQRMF